MVGWVLPDGVVLGQMDSEADSVETSVVACALSVPDKLPLRETVRVPEPEAHKVGEPVAL